MIGVLVLIYTVAVFVIYHKIFDVYYFGGVGHGIIKELFGSFIAACFLAGLTVYLWWVTDIIIILVGLGLAGKSDNPQTKKMIIGAFVVLAIVIAVMGISYRAENKKDADSSSESAQSSFSDTSDLSMNLESSIANALSHRTIRFEV